MFSFRSHLVVMSKHSLGDLRMRLPRLSLRIWKLLDAHAEGPLAIGALALIVLSLVLAKYLAEL
jgi:hypothetical protein